MKRIVALLIAALALTVGSPSAGAAETRVYFSISVGGAMVVGGGLLFWSLTYGSVRVSKRGTEPQPIPSLLSSVGDDPLPLHSDRSTDPNEDLIRLPLLIYRW
jgi:hypothetical protein